MKSWLFGFREFQAKLQNDAKAPILKLWTRFGAQNEADDYYIHIFCKFGPVEISVPAESSTNNLEFWKIVGMAIFRPKFLGIQKLLRVPLFTFLESSDQADVLCTPIRVHNAQTASLSQLQYRHFWFYSFEGFLLQINFSWIGIFYQNLKKLGIDAKWVMEEFEAVKCVYASTGVIEHEYINI